MKAYVPVVFALAAGACGSDSDTGENTALCEDLNAKVTECRLNIDISGSCKTDVAKEILCAAKCAVKASCAEITGPAMSNAYYQCLAVCSGGSADDFICADGSAFLPQRGVCDGAAQCPDGSDEANCPP